MIKAIPMEDWLRGCIYHDGRNGYVTLPTDKVHQIANYIQRTRRSGADGLIDFEVVEPHIVGKHADAIIINESSDSEKPNNCEELNAYRKCVESRSFWDNKHCDGCYFDERCPFDEPTDESTRSKMEQVDKDTNVRSKDYCETCKHDLWHTPRMCGKCVRQEDGKPSMYEPKTEPQTDEPTWEQVKEYCNKRCLDIVDSAMRKQWYKDEPQTDCAWGKGASDD